MVTNPLPSHPPQPTSFLSIPSATVPTTTSFCNSTNTLIDLTETSPTSTDFPFVIASPSRLYALFFWIPDTVSIHTFQEVCALSNINGLIKEKSPSPKSTHHSNLRFRGVIHFDTEEKVLDAFQKLSYQCFNMGEFFQVELSVPRSLVENLSKLIFYYPSEIQPLAPAHFHQICAFHLPPNSFPILGVYKSSNQKELSIFFPKKSLPSNLTSSNLVDLPSYVVAFNTSDDAILVHSRLSTMLKAKKISLTHLELIIGSATYFTSMESTSEKEVKDLSNTNVKTEPLSKHPNGCSMSTTTFVLPSSPAVPSLETIPKSSLHADYPSLNTPILSSSLNSTSSHQVLAPSSPSRKRSFIVIEDSPPPSPTLESNSIPISCPSSPYSSPKKSPLLTTDPILLSTSTSTLYPSTDSTSLSLPPAIVNTSSLSSSSSPSLSSSFLASSPALPPLHMPSKVSSPSTPQISFTSTSSPCLISSPTSPTPSLPPFSDLSSTVFPVSSSLPAVPSTPPLPPPISSSSSSSSSSSTPSFTSISSQLSSPCPILRKKRRIQPNFVGPLPSTTPPLQSNLPPSSSVNSALLEDSLFISPTPLPHLTPPVPSYFPMDLFEPIRPTFLTTLLNFCASASSSLSSTPPPITPTVTPPSWMETAHAIYEFLYQHHVSLPIQHVVLGGTIVSEDIIHVWVTSDRYLLLYHLHLTPFTCNTVSDATSASETHRYMLAVAKEHRLGNYQRFQYSGFYLSMTFPIQWVMYEPKVNYPLLVYEKKIKTNSTQNDMESEILASTPSSSLETKSEESILSLRNNRGEPILNLIHPNPQYHSQLIKCLRKQDYVVGWCVDKYFCVWEIPAMEKDIPRTLAPKKDGTFPCSANVPILDVALDVSNSEIRLFILTKKELCEWKFDSEVKTIYNFDLPETISPSDCKLAVSPHASHLVVCLASKLIVFNSSTSPATFLIEWTQPILPSLPCNTKLLFDPYRPTIFLSLIQGQLKMWDIQSNTGLLFVHRLNGTLDMDIVSSDIFPSTIVTLQSGSNSFHSKSQPLSLCTFRVFPWLYTAIDTPLS